MPTGSYYPQLEVQFPIGKSILGLEISESWKAVGEKKLPNGDLKYPIGDIIPKWIVSSVSPLVVK